MFLRGKVLLAVSGQGRSAESKQKLSPQSTHFSGSLLVSKENIPRSEPSLLQAVQHLVQIAALGGVQAAHLVVSGGEVRHHDGDETPGGPGADAVVAVLQHQRMGGGGAQSFCGQQEDLGVRLGRRDLLAGEDGLEVPGPPRSRDWTN